MPNRDVTRARYLDALLAMYGTLRLPIRSSSEEFLPLQTIFQPLRLRSGSFSFEAEESENTGSTLASNGAEALAKSSRRRMVVLGGPGMGKTTLLKELLQRAIHAAQTADTAPLPLFISLPDLARSGLRLAEYLPYILIELKIDVDYSHALVEAIEQGRAFLCLDSLDEVIPAQRPDIIALVDNEVTRCGGTWVVGSRFTEYKGGQFVQGQFAEWELQALDEEMRLQLAEHLLPIVARLLQQPSTPAAEAFIKALENDTRLAGWSTNPLLFSLAAIVYTQAGMLPSCRAALYHDIIEIMLSGRITNQQERTELRTVLADISLQFYQTRGRNFTVPELFELLATHYPNLSYQAHSDMLARILDSGLLDVVAHQTYGFKHQMFQEYLAAVALATRLLSPNATERAAAWDFAWRKHTYSRWREILRLCVGVLVHEFGQEGSEIAIRWLNRLMAEQNTPAGDVGHLCLELALGSLREFPSIPEDSELARAAQGLVMGWAKLLVKQQNWRLHRFAVDVKMLDLHLVLPTIAWLEHKRDADSPNEDEEQIENRIDNLFSQLDITKVDTDIPVRVFTCAYPESHGISLYASLLPTTLQAHASQEQLIHLALNHTERWSARVGAIRLLGEWEKLTPVDVLCSIAENTSNDYKIRSATIEELGKQDKRLPIARLLPLLQDKDKHIRTDVIDMLVSAQQHIPLELLLMLLDDLESVSTQALRALGQIYPPENIELEPFMRMLQDDNANKRAAALYLLGKRTPIEQLIRAMRDPSQQVYGTALRLAYELKEHIPTSTLLDFIQHHYTEGNRSTDKEDQFLCSKALEIVQQPERAISGEFLCAFALEHNLLQLAFSIALTQHITLPMDVLLEGLNHYYDTFTLAQELLAQQSENTPVVKLIETLQDTSVYIRINAARQLSQCAPLAPSEQELILQHLHRIIADTHTYTYIGSRNYEMYSCLTFCLLRSGTSVPAESLLHALAGNPNLHNQEKDEVVLALKKLGAQTPLIALLRMVSENTPHCDWHQEERATEVLASLYTWITPAMLQEMAQKRRHEDERMALKVLEAPGKQAPIEFIRSILDDPDRNIHLRAKARSVLHTAGVHLPLTYFLAETSIGHESPDYETIESVRELGPLAPIDELLQILTWTYDWTRVPFFLPEVKEGSNLAHQTAVQALRAIAAHVPIEPLVAALEHSDAMVRNGAVRVLGAFGERAPLDKLLAFQEKYGTQDELWETFAELRAYVSQEAITRALYSLNKDMKSDPFWILEKWEGDLPLEPLLALANNPEYNQRSQAIRILGQLQDRAPLDFLLALLESKDEEDVKSAAYALSEMGPYAPLDRLRALYHTNSDLREDLLMYALGHMGEHAPLDVILQALDDEDCSVREAAGYALSHLAEAAPALYVTTLKDDPRPPVREALLEALVKMGKEATLDLALAALYDENEEIRRQAHRTLAELDIDPDLLPLEPLLLGMKQGKTHWADLALLAKMGPRVPAEPLLALLGDSDIDTCAYAAKALYQTHPEEFAEVARQAEAILRGEPTGDVFASRVQGRIADRVASIGRATSAVLEMITDLLDWPYWEVQVKAAEALKAVHRHIPDRAIRRLLELRRDPTSQAVREAADEALAEILSRESGMEDE